MFLSFCAWKEIYPRPIEMSFKQKIQNFKIFSDKGVWSQINQRIVFIILLRDPVSVLSGETRDIQISHGI